MRLAILSGVLPRFVVATVFGGLAATSGFGPKPGDAPRRA